MLQSVARPASLNPSVPAIVSQASVSAPGSWAMPQSWSGSALGATHRANPASAPLLAALRAPTASGTHGVARTASANALVEQLLHDCPRAQAEAIFNALPPVSTESMHGTWRGAEVSGDHPLSGLLPSFGWYGKRFDNDEAVHPLLFNKVGGGIFAVNPGWVPMSIGAYVPRWRVGKWLMTALKPIVGTKAPKARLRDVKYQGVVSAAMVYDQLPIIDAFRKIDDDTVLGAMDYRANPEPFYFLLRRA